MANPEPTSDCSKDVREPTLVKNALSSCLRDSNKSPKRQLANRSVSFPENDNQIVTGYLEPVNPWEFAESTNKETVLVNYTRSCEKHKVLPIKRVLDQLENYDYDEIGNDRFESLNLDGVWLTLGSCEALEEVLKRLQFYRINLEDTGLDDEAAVAIFDMIEYYEAATKLNISNNNSIGVRGWQAASRMLKRTKCLEELECRSTALSEQVVPILSRALRLGTQLQVLKLESCCMSGRSLVVLVASLKLNTTLKELYLGENYLGPTDGLQLSGLLKCNTTLQLLDLSNNGLEDNGVMHICDALCEQSRPAGLGILILWNNKLGPGCAHHIARALRGNNTLEMLNVGHNDLGDGFLKDIEEPLIDNRSLLRLGIQSTGITGEGALTLSNILAKNPVLQRIDLRDNNMEVTGVLALAESMKNNTSITQLDIDDRPRGRIVGNETKRGGRLRSPAPSPIPSPVASPSPTRTRFQVSRVSEDSPPESSPEFSYGAPKTNRFKVTVVEPHEQPPAPIPIPVVQPPPQSNPGTPPRARKLSSWVPMVSPGLESKAASGLEKLLGLFQNPFRGGSGGGNTVDSNSDGSGATWPSGRPTPATVDSGSHSASLSHLAVIPPTG